MPWRSLVRHASLNRYFASTILLSLLGCRAPSPLNSPERPPVVALSVAPAPPASPVAARPPKGRWVYEGTLAGKNVLVRLSCEATTCGGYYFYEGIGESLALVETLPNEFDEQLGVGKNVRVTGHLAFTTPAGGERWAGTWSVDAKSPQSIVLAQVHPSTPPRSLKRTFSDKTPTAKDECKVRVTSFELVGLANAALEERLNARIRPETLALESEHVALPEVAVDEMCGKNQCDVSLKGYRMLCRDFNGRAGLFFDEDVRPTVLDDTLLSARSEYGFDGGGVHPSDGVGGITIDLHDGHILDARDLLKTPASEPAWEKLVPPAFFQKLGSPFTPRDVTFALGTNEGAQRRSVSDELVWADFFLTPSGFELVPRVPEVLRMLRHDVQHVPFQKVRAALLPNGPASHLYAR
jgi:hypothetical protein